jgi:hypothetical protein
MTEPNRAQRRAAAKKGEEPVEVDGVRITINGESVETVLGTREIAYLELRVHKQDEMAEKGSSSMWLMAHAHLLMAKQRGEFSADVPEVFDEFLVWAEVEPLIGGGGPKASATEPSTET